MERAGDHPANLAWWNEYASENHAELAAETYEFIRERDPNHPVTFLLNWGGALGDAYFVYAYPILNPLLPDDSITSMLELTLDPAFESAEPEGKQVWFISQAFDYRLDSNRGQIVTLEGGFRPSREEIRAMNYLALARGVKALVFYAAGGEIPGTEYTNDVAIYPRQWTEVLKLSGEIRYLAPTLAAGAAVRSVQLEQDGEAIHFTERLHDGVHTLIAVNVDAGAGPGHVAVRPARAAPGDVRGPRCEHGVQRLHRPLPAPGGPRLPVAGGGGLSSDVAG